MVKRCKVQSLAQQHLLERVYGRRRALPLLEAVEVDLGPVVPGLRRGLRGRQ